MALTKVGKKGLQDGALTTTAASAPTVGAKGELFYNTTQNKLYVSNGTAWTMVSNDAPSATGGTVVISTLNEGATFSYNLGTNFTDDSNTDAELTYSLESGTLPGGATLPTSGNSAMTGTVGNVSSNTVYTFSIRATDVAGATATQDYQQQINTVAATVTGGTVTISSVNEGSSASYDVDTNFTFGTGSTFSAYSLVSGSLPSGLSFNTSTGVISGTMGTVSADTAYSFTIRGTDTDGDTADQAYSWTITNIVYTVATGGTVVTSGDYKIHTFTSSGTFSVSTLGTDAIADFLVIAGGGGGGGDTAGGHGGGGGGGGGALYGTGVALTSASYLITIGGGGGGSQVRGATGYNSVIGTLNATALGGGGGGEGGGGAQRDGLNGGSGGGGGSPGNTAGSTIQGNSGGLTGYGNDALTSTTSGGGGAGSTPVNGGGWGSYGSGGAGKLFAIDGIYRAGGGGCGSDVGAPPPGSGGSGGGGGGGTHSGTSGAANYGGGGGGGGADGPSTGYGAAGGSGIVVIKYKFQ